MSIQVTQEVLLNLLSFKSFDSQFPGQYKFRFRLSWSPDPGAEPKAAKPYFVAKDSSATYSHRTFESEVFRPDLNYEVVSKSMAGFRLSTDPFTAARKVMRLEAGFLLKGLDANCRKRFPEDHQEFSLLETRFVDIDFSQPVVEFTEVYFESVIPCRVRLLVAVYQTGYAAAEPATESVSFIRFDGRPPESAPHIFNGPRVFYGDQPPPRPTSDPPSAQRQPLSLPDALTQVFEGSPLSADSVVCQLLEPQQRSLANIYCLLAEQFDFIARLDISDDIPAINRLGSNLVQIESSFGADETKFLLPATDRRTNFKYRALPTEGPSSQKEIGSSESTQETVRPHRPSANGTRDFRIFDNSQTNKSPGSRSNLARSPREQAQWFMSRSHSLSGVLAQFQALLLEMHPKFNQYWNSRGQFDQRMKIKAVTERLFEERSALTEALRLADRTGSAAGVQGLCHTIRRAAAEFRRQLTRLQSVPPEEAVRCHPLFFETDSPPPPPDRLSRPEFKASDFAPYQRFNHFKRNDRVLIDDDLVYCQPRSIYTHLVVLVHGFKGSEFDLRLYKSRLQDWHKHIKCLISCVNVGVENESISTLGLNLAREVKEYVVARRLQFVKKVSFVGHSLGGLIVRAAIPHLYDLKGYLDTYLSLGTPHLGVLSHNSLLMQAGLALFKQFNGNRVLSALTLSDSKDLESTELFKLAHNGALSHFKKLVFVGGREDGYSSLEGAVLEPTDGLAAVRNTGPKLVQMANALNASAAKLPTLRINVEMVVGERNLDWLIGRTPHILLIDNEEVVEGVLGRLWANFAESDV